MVGFLAHRCQVELIVFLRNGGLAGFWMAQGLKEKSHVGVPIMRDPTKQLADRARATT